MSEFGKLTFESVFCGSDAPLKPSHITNETNNKSSKSKDDLDSFLKKTPLMILEEIAKGILQQTPSWSSAEISGTAPIEFEMTLSFNGKTLKARGNSKKSAKQKVALEFLHLAVNDGRRVEFFIPGETDEDAHINIDRISERAEDIKRPNPVAPKDLDRSIPTVREFPEGVPDKNWVGALQERCQKLKLEAPCYEDVRIESSCEFIVTCTMRNQKTRGVKSKVKAAKNLAAWLMLKSLEEGPGAVQSFDDLSEDLEEMEREENLAKYRQGVFDMKDAKAALIDVLSDKKRFTNYIMEFEYPCISVLGVHQILLRIDINGATSPESDDLQMGAEHTHTEEITKAENEKEREKKKNMPESGRKVFPGSGSSAEAAIQSSCRAALLHFHTYDYAA